MAGYSIRYDAAGGGHVEIKFPLNPYKVLGVSPTAAWPSIKGAFFNKINQESRQNRATVSIANHILTSTVGRYKREKDNTFSFVPIINPNPSIVFMASTISAIFGNHFMLAAAGHTERLAKRIRYNVDILSAVDEHERTLLYLACKSGFYDTSKLLLTEGASVDKPQVDGSTPLHAASFYGHTLVVGLLLEHGAATNIKNRWGSTALDESRNEEIKSLIQAASKDAIVSLTAQLKDKGLVTSVRLIKHKGEVIGKELFRDLRFLDVSTKEYWDDIEEHWECVWHGTRYNNLLSILEKGLLPSGSNGIKPPEGHIALDENVFGIKNWAAAIFVSPSILYAAHPVYAERVISEKKNWCVLVKAFFNPKPMSYTAHDTTTLGRSSVKGEPDNLEFRVPVPEEKKDMAWRVECFRNIVVRSVVFAKIKFLEDGEVDFEQASKIFA